MKKFNFFLIAFSALSLVAAAAVFEPAWAGGGSKRVDFKLTVENNTCDTWRVVLKAGDAHKADGNFGPGTRTSNEKNTKDKISKVTLNPFSGGKCTMNSATRKNCKCPSKKSYDFGIGYPRIEKNKEFHVTIGRGGVVVKVDGVEKARKE